MRQKAQKKVINSVCMSLALVCIYSLAEYWQNFTPNHEIHIEVYILIDMCSAEARVIISTGSTKFHPSGNFLICIFP